MLQILDIAFNNFSGKLLGKYFSSWKGTMMNDKEEVGTEYTWKPFYLSVSFYYQDRVTVISKGQQIELVKIFKIFRSIDFSSNHSEGSIPEELMNFKALYVLNLSNNALSSEIPPSIGNMKQLESLDLSQNSLRGEIPVQLASLSFLSYLNLSFNHLVGKIPTGTQLQSFPASSFEGNDGLYGSPLTEKHDGNDPGLLPQPECGRLACTVDWNCFRPTLDGFWPWNCFRSTLDLEAMEGTVLAAYSQNSLLDLPSDVSSICDPKRTSISNFNVAELVINNKCATTCLLKTGGVKPGQIPSIFQSRFPEMRLGLTILVLKFLSDVARARDRR